MNAINVLNACSLVWPVCEGHMNSEHAIANTKRSWFVEAFSMQLQYVLVICTFIICTIDYLSKQNH